MQLSGPSRESSWLHASREQAPTQCLPRGLLVLAVAQRLADGDQVRLVAILDAPVAQAQVA